MDSPLIALEQAVSAAARTALGADLPPGPHVRPATDTRHGDFQTNLAMVLAKQAKANPRELAAKIVAALGESDLHETPEIAGPGFINLRLKPTYVAEQALTRAGDGRLGIPTDPAPRTFVIDFSAPNVAKEMHVGHLRSTVLGDCLARLHRFLGHTVITDNHIGDWGTQFGIVILGYKRHGNDQELAKDPFDHLEGIYRATQSLCKEDDKEMALAREELHKLQNNDSENREIWGRFVSLTFAAINKLYKRLDVEFNFTLGESFYNDQLASVVDELLEKGIARESEGAICVFSEGKLPPKEDPLKIADKNAESGFRDNPFLIRKSDGASLYATTDLATLAFREDAGPNGLKIKYEKDINGGESIEPVTDIIYVTDARQQMHFNQLFATAQRWGKANPPRLEHVWFGAILGPNKKPLKTREGKNVKLKELLDEAEKRARAIITEKRPELDGAQADKIARTVGLGALKYADLGQNRNLDYVFAWDKLLSFDGNTAPYLQNAYVRIRSIFRKAGLTDAPSIDKLLLEEPAELALAKKLLGFGDVIALAAEESRPHVLCQYLFELATLFHKFYEACPVLKDGVSPALRDSRLVLANFTANTLRQGLHLLGISVEEEM